MYWTYYYFIENHTEKIKSGSSTSSSITMYNGSSASTTLEPNTTRTFNTAGKMTPYNMSINGATLSCAGKMWENNLIFSSTAASYTVTVTNYQESGEIGNRSTYASPINIYLDGSSTVAATLLPGQSTTFTNCVSSSITIENIFANRNTTTWSANDYWFTVHSGTGSISPTDIIIGKSCTFSIGSDSTMTIQAHPYPSASGNFSRFDWLQNTSNGSSSANGYLDTNLAPYLDLEMDCKYQLLDSYWTSGGYGNILGSRYASNNKEYQLSAYSGGTVSIGARNTSVSNIASTDIRRVYTTYANSTRTAWVLYGSSSSSKALTTGSSFYTGNIYCFGINNGGTANQNQWEKIYFLRLTDKTNDPNAVGMGTNYANERCLVPALCKISTTRYHCMFDIFNQKIYIGTYGYFTAGND